MFGTPAARARTALGLALTTLAAAGIAAGPASAATTSTAAASCASSTLLQPFTAWGDTNQYRLVAVPAGGAGWTLTGGASVISGGDPFKLTGAPTAYSVSLPAGATATTPFSCVDVTQPTFRYLEHAMTPSAGVVVSVVYVLPSGGTIGGAVGVQNVPSAWTPSPTLATGAQLASVLLGSTPQMAVRFTALSGTSQIDDVFIDPHHGWG